MARAASGPPHNPRNAATRKHQKVARRPEFSAEPEGKGKGKPAGAAAKTEQPKAKAKAKANLNQS